jgi:hypothetical protein
LHAEAKHRALFNFSIVDVRVFNYFSHTQDMNARFLITDNLRYSSTMSSYFSVILKISPPIFWAFSGSPIPTKLGIT